MALPPGPELPALVQTFYWIRRPVPFLHECARRYGDFFTVNLLQSEPVVACSNPETIKRLFTGSGDLFHAGEAAKILEPFVGKSSLLLLDGASHMRQRRLMLPAFHGERMKAYADTMRDITIDSLSSWPRDQPFALHPHTQHITLQVILRTVFGVEDAERMQVLAEALTTLMNQGQSPRMLWALIPLNIGPRRQFARQLARVNDLIYDEIARRRDDPELENRTDVLSMMMSARDEDGNPMSDIELRDELMTLLAAGHETTATSLAWTFERVLSKRRVYDRLRDELDATIGGAPVTEDSVRELGYLDAVIKEVLRLRPIIPMVVRKIQVPMMVHGYELPAGTVVAPNIFLTQRRPDLFPDPDEFRPERFLGVKPDPYTWFPFGGGIRRCLGMAFALYEMKIVIASILSRLDLCLAPGSTGRLARRSITFAPSDGSRVIVRDRHRAATPARASAS
jgi:cytochrome P450